MCGFGVKPLNVKEVHNKLGIHLPTYCIRDERLSRPCPRTRGVEARYATTRPLGLMRGEKHNKRRWGVRLGDRVPSAEKRRGDRSGRGLAFPPRAVFATAGALERSRGGRLCSAWRLYRCSFCRFD
ncbi:hypothetical protein TNCV_403831 [Trichonephila clavipes]|nr:hypothetical protein TNCV_403831 [Trichonephila clavipes]